MESSPERLAHNLPVAVGLVSDPRAALAALRLAVERGAPAPSARPRGAATQRLPISARAGAHAYRRAAKRWDSAPNSMPRFMAEIGRAARIAIVVESITAGPDLARTVHFERAGDYVGARGGGIGQACPARSA